MLEKDKKEIYNRIMEQVSKDVKKMLNEMEIYKIKPDGRRYHTYSAQLNKSKTKFRTKLDTKNRFEEIQVKDNYDINDFEPNEIIHFQNKLVPYFNELRTRSFTFKDYSNIDLVFANNEGEYILFDLHDIPTKQSGGLMNVWILEEGDVRIKDYNIQNPDILDMIENGNVPAYQMLKMFNGIQAKKVCNFIKNESDEYFDPVCFTVSKKDFATNPWMRILNQS